MVLQGTCSACGHRITAADDKSGELAKCIYCGALTLVGTLKMPPPLPPGTRREPPKPPPGNPPPAAPQT